MWLLIQSMLVFMGALMPLLWRLASSLFNGFMKTKQNSPWIQPPLQNKAWQSLVPQLRCRGTIILCLSWVYCSVALQPCPCLLLHCWRWHSSAPAALIKPKWQHRLFWSFLITSLCFPTALRMVLLYFCSLIFSAYQMTVQLARKRLLIQ